MWALSAGMDPTWRGQFLEFSYSEAGGEVIQLPRRTCFRLFWVVRLHSFRLDTRIRIATSIHFSAQSGRPDGYCSNLPSSRLGILTEKKKNRFVSALTSNVLLQSQLRKHCFRSGQQWSALLENLCCSDGLCLKGTSALLISMTPVAHISRFYKPLM